MLVKEHCHDDPTAVCVHCLKKHGEMRKKKVVYLTINHLSRRLYLTEELYTTWDPIYMEICCTVCNRLIERGQMSCPVCHNAYISALDPDKMCQKCFFNANPRLKEIHDQQLALKKITEKNKKDAIKADLKKKRQPLIDAQKKKDKEFRKKLKKK
jgi:hypothetical protein